MDNKTRIETLDEKEYQVLFGIRKPTFEHMLSILESADKAKHKQGGRPSRLSALDKLVVTLGYHRDYRTMQNIAFDYSVSKSRISDAVKWVEQTIIKDESFALPSKREFFKTESPSDSYNSTPASFKAFLDSFMDSSNWLRIPCWNASMSKSFQ